MNNSRKLLKQRRGFTLVEVLIVVVILGILASTVLPQFTSAGNDSRESALMQDLQTLRSQVELYRFQHQGAYPGAGADTFEDQMLKSTTSDGTVGAIGVNPYGPYFVGQLPPNPYNGKRGIAIVTTDVSAVLSGALNVDALGQEAGWIYNAQTGQMKANSTGVTSNGTPLDEI